MVHDIYTLLANQLLDIHHLLTEKILADKKHAPRWQVVEIAIPGKSPEFQVDELGSLLGLAGTISRLAEHHATNEPPTAEPTVIEQSQ